MVRFVLVVMLAACGPGAPGGPTMNNKIGGNDLPPQQSSSVASAEILAREPVANVAQVKHILISWKDKADAFNGRQNPRAQQRSKADAEAEVRSLVAQLQKGGDFDSLMKAHSEDAVSASTGMPFKVTTEAQLVIEFKQLALRLNRDEYGVVESDFGFHIIKRYE